MLQTQTATAPGLRASILTGLCLKPNMLEEDTTIARDQTESRPDVEFSLMVNRLSTLSEHLLYCVRILDETETEEGPTSNASILIVGRGKGQLKLRIDACSPDSE